MFSLLLKKELQEVLLTTKFVTTFAACLVLAIIAFVGGAHNYKVMQAEYEAATTANLKQMEGLTDWWRISHHVYLPPKPLAALVSGISNDIGRTTQMSTQGELQSEDSRYGEAPIHAVFRILDLEFLITVVLSLFAIVFAYDAVNGEKERGTLRLSFSTPVPRDQYILSKLVGAIVALGVPLMVSILIGAALLPVLGISLSGEEWLRLALVVLAAYLYLGVFLGMAVFISSITSRSSTSFLLILVVWITAVMIVPRTSVLLAGRAVDVPSVDRVNFEKQQFRAQLQTEDAAAMRVWQQENPLQGNRDSLMAWSERFQNFLSDQREATGEKVDEFNSRLNEERDNRVVVRQSLALGFARVSPAAVFSIVAGHLAGTSLDLKGRYLNSAEQYQSLYASFREEKAGSSGGFRIVIHDDNEDEPPEEIDPQELPVFGYQEASLSQVVGAVAPGLGLLAVLNVLFAAAAFVAFLRYDVR